MDLATIVGLFLGIFLISTAILTGASPGIFINIPSVLIVMGGTMAAVMIRFPINEFKNAFAVGKHAFSSKMRTQEEIVRQFVELAYVARKEGLLALENVEIDDSFMRRGIDYCVDGSEPSHIQTMLRKEIEYSVKRHEKGIKIFSSMGDSAPAFGMIGTLIGLVQMLTTMDDPSTIGPAMAVALLTTLYGSLIANLFCIPVSDKLEHRSSEETALRMMVVEGVLGLRRGENPRMLEEALHTFVAPSKRAETQRAAA